MRAGALVDFAAFGWYQKKVQQSGGFRNILKLHELFRGRYALLGLDHLVAPRTAQRRRSLRALSAVAMVCALGAMMLSAGCDTYDPNLGAAAFFSSNISVLSPSSRNAGCSGFTLDVRGGGFISGAIVLWNGSPRTTTFETSTELLATITASDIATPGAVPVVVTLPGQTQGNEQSNTVSFTINSPVPPDQCTAPPVFAPNIASVVSNGAPSGKVGDSVTITGSYFGDSQGTSTVTFGGTTATVATATNWTATSIVVPVPTGATTGPVVVTVDGLQSNSVIFTVISSSAVLAPAPSSTSPSLVTAGVGNPVSSSAGDRYIAIVATTSDASTSGSAGLDKIFLRDTCLGASGSCTPRTILVSEGLNGAEPNGPSRAPAISADGRFVAFESDASDLVAGDDNRVGDIFVRDTCLGVSAGCLPTTSRVSLGPAASEANGASSSPSLSSDGRFVAFDSAATNLTLDAAPVSAGNAAGTFVRDTCFGATGACTPSTARLMTSLPAQ